MLGKLTQSFSTLISGISRKKTLTSENVEESVRMLRLALIEADVNLSVIRSFLDEVREKTVGKEVLRGLTPADTFVKAVHDALVNLLGGTEASADANASTNANTNTNTNVHTHADVLALRPPTQITSVLVSGLQGSGKTTTLGKLALHYKGKRDVLLVSLDASRPAAALQLQQLSEQAKVGYFDRGEETNAKRIIRQAEKYAKKHAHNLIFYDTAGRTQLSTEMLKELKEIARICDPQESLLVLDSMLGQEALKIAEAFKATLRLSGLIFTKFDSDTSGGAVLSVKHTLDIPVRFMGVGESLDKLMAFDAVRMAERILGMGDIVGLVEQAEKTIEPKDSEKLAKRLASNEFDLSDMLAQLQQIGKMGSLKSIASMIPGMGAQVEKMAPEQFNEKEMVYMRAIIQSMTDVERHKPFMLNNSRKIRIARGSGTNVVKVNQTLKKFSQMKTMLKKMKRPGKMQELMAQLGGGGANGPNNMGALGGLDKMGGGMPDKSQLASLMKSLKKGNTR